MQLQPNKLGINLKRPVFLWNLIIRNTTRDGQFTETLKTYTSMFNSGVHGNNYTFPLLFKACAKLNSIRDGTILHSHSFLLGYHLDVFVQTALIDMYSHCSDHHVLSTCRQLFDEMPLRSVISWNSMISAYCRHSRVHDSITLLKQMHLLGFELTPTTFLGVISVCDIRQGLCVHCYVMKLGLLHLDLPLSNSVISMYSRFSQMDAARSVFYTMEVEKSIVSWTSLVGGYIGIGNVAEAFGVFNQMRLLQSVSLDTVVFVNLITGCVKLGNLLLAMSVHSLILKSGCDHKDPIDNLLVSLYAKCGDLCSAQIIFDMAVEKSVFLWTSMIGAYAHLGCPKEAFDLFKRMLRTNLEPSGGTVATVLSACADMGSLSKGKEIEECILGNGLESDFQVQTSLIHMYCKCGSIEMAKAVFERVSNKDLAVWSSMINGYAIHGMGEEALNLFHRMETEERIKPDAGVYTSILLACSHSGLVENGLKYFQSMQKKFGIEPSIEHYTCLVDLLSRVGYFDLALKTIQEMPIQVKPQVWAPFLSACKTHQNHELGEFAAKKLLELDPSSSSNYVSVANLYTSAGKYKEAALARESIKKGALPKEPGWSQI